MFEKKEIEFAHLPYVRGRESRITAERKDRKKGNSRSSIRRGCKEFLESCLGSKFRSAMITRCLLIRTPPFRLPFFNRSPLFLPIDSQPRLWGDRSLHVVTAVISTDYILVRDLFLQRFHPIRGHVVSNLGTETARFSSRIEGKDFLPRVNENIFARTR